MATVIMRFLSLYGLVGLVSLGVTSPTPPNSLAHEVPVGLSASPAKRLVLYSQDNFQGPWHEIEATNRCVKLEPPVYKNLHSYGVVDQVCYFMDTDRCNGKVLITADAQGTEVWRRVDVGEVNGFAGRIAAVYCGKQGLANAVEANVVPVKRDESTILDTLIGPGETIVCENTLENGRCETLSVNSACVPIPAGLAHNFHTIYQAGGSVCKYYDSTCDATTPVLSLNSKKQNTFLQVPQDVASRIGVVKCQSIWTEDGADSITSRADKRTVSAKGDVRACKGNNCSWVQALNSCKAFSDDVVQQIDSILQTAGSTCDYWTNKDCSRLILTSISGSNDYSPNLGPGNEDGLQISAVSCRASRFADTLEGGSTFHASDDISSEVDPARSPAVLEARSATSTLCDVPIPNRKIGPGFLYFCATTNNDPSLKKPEDCANYRTCMEQEAMDECVSLKQARNLFPLFDSLWQAPGAVCKYYKSSCKDKWPVLIIDSRKGFLPSFDYRQLPFSPVITEARCYHHQTAAVLGAGPDTIVLDSTSSLHARYTDDTPLKDALSVNQAGQVLDANQPYLKGKILLTGILPNDHNCAPFTNHSF